MMEPLNSRYSDCKSRWVLRFLTLHPPANRQSSIHPLLWRKIFERTMQGLEIEIPCAFRAVFIHHVAPKVFQGFDGARFPSHHIFERFCFRNFAFNLQMNGYRLKDLLHHLRREIQRTYFLLNDQGRLVERSNQVTGRIHHDEEGYRSGDRAVSSLSSIIFQVLCMLLKSFLKQLNEFSLPRRFEALSLYH